MIFMDILLKIPSPFKTKTFVWYLPRLDVIIRHPPLEVNISAIQWDLESAVPVYWIHLQLKFQNKKENGTTATTGKSAEIPINGRQFESTTQALRDFHEWMTWMMNLGDKEEACRGERISKNHDTHVAILKCRDDTTESSCSNSKQSGLATLFMSICHILHERFDSPLSWNCFKVSWYAWQVSLQEAWAVIYVGWGANEVSCKCRAGK